MDKILDGKRLAEKHEEALKGLLAVRKDRAPKIVSFCNNADDASVKYTQMKAKKAEELGLEFETIDYGSDTSKEEIVDRILELNDNPSVDGIMIQLPLAETLENDKEELLNLISPLKDVDGLGEKSKFIPATIRGVLSILNEYIEDWEEKKIAVVGATGEVGQDMIFALENKGIKPLEISRKADNFSGIKNAEIVISATGVNGLIKPDQIQEGAILIDIGLGDFEESCFERASFYTPKVGGVGPMTVISLMENVVESYLRTVVE